MQQLNTNKPTLTLKVLQIISEHTIESPITGESIAQLTGTTWREVAHIIEMLRFMGFKIGSSKTKPMGYFMARHPEEIRPTAERMKKQCLVQLKQVQKMYVWDNQPTIFDSVELEAIDKAINEFEQITGEKIA